MDEYTNKKVLIIREEQDEFEIFCSNHMRRENVDVMTPYRKVDGLGHYIRAICKRSGNHFLQRYWINEWKKKIDKYDYIIVFDNCATDILLKWIADEKLSAKIILWLWNIPSNSISSLEKYVDEVACFDELYCRANGYRFVHQFYFKDINIVNEQSKWDLIYVGTDKERYEMLKPLASYASSRKLRYEIYLYNKTAYSENDVDEFGIRKSNIKIPYEELLKMIFSSKAIIELNLVEQSGLTLRALEALFLGRKLITNNRNIKSFDFYNRNNIFVINEEVESINDFLKKPCVPISELILEQYTYDDWLRKIIG